MSDEIEVTTGAASLTKPPRQFARTPRQRSGDRRREANKLIEAAKTTLPDERKCNGKVKLRDDEGNYLRDDAGTILTRPCLKPPIKGGFVCMSHGGSAEHVRKKANKRLLALAEPALVRLEALMHQEEHLPTALGAIKEVLNRAGGAAIGPVDPNAGKQDMRPVINVGIQVGGIDPSKRPEVKVGIVSGSAPAVDAEIVDDEDQG